MKKIDKINLFIQSLIISGKIESQKEFGRKLGYKNESSFSQLLKKEEVSGKFLNRILEFYPEFEEFGGEYSSNPFKLDEGITEGKELKNKASVSATKKNKFRIYESKTIEEITQELAELPKGELSIKTYPAKLSVRLVTNKAQAGWSDGFYADEFLEDMPIVMIDADREYSGKYLAFEVQGDSMEPDYLEGDIVICREVQRNLWSGKLHFRDWDFVIAHSTQGIMLKEITAHDVDKGIITCHSINPKHSDFKINLREVTFLYNVVEVRQKGSRKRWNRAKDFYIEEE